MKTPKEKSISELIKDHRNANKHSEKGMQMLRDGIIKNGLGRSILLSADDEIIAGGRKAIICGISSQGRALGNQPRRGVRFDHAAHFNR